MITFPLGILPWSLSSAFNARVSFLRINKFYNEDEIVDEDVNYIEK
jgi:hypothetical protein